MESKTPRTDAAEAWANSADFDTKWSLQVVESSEMRKLELELASKDAEIDRLNGILDGAIGNKKSSDALIKQILEAFSGVCEVCPCDTRLEEKKCQTCDIGLAIEAAKEAGK